MADARATPGRVKEITSSANPLIKEIRALDRKKVRDETGTFLVEGLQLITYAIEAGWQVKTLVHAKSVADRPQVQKVAARTRAKGTDILVVSEKVLSAVSRRDNPQMVLAVMAQQSADLSYVEAKPETTWVALDRVRDPGNLGTIIRTCDAAGVAGILLVGETTDPFATETVRASMGSIFNVKMVRSSPDGFADLATRWRSAGGKVIGTHLEGAMDFRQVDYKGGPQILLMGNEQQGLPDDLVRVCDDLAFIPMAGKAESLNLAIASGLMIYEARRHLLSGTQPAPARPLKLQGEDVS